MSKRWLRAIARYPAPMRVGIFLVMLAIAWLPFHLSISALIPDPNAASILTMVALFVAFLLLVRLWGRRVHGIAHPLQHYGLGRGRHHIFDLLQGFGLGAISLLSLFGIQSLLGWTAWSLPALGSGGAILRMTAEGLAVGLAVGLGEELVFRGWLLDEGERDYSPATALWVSSLLFAVLHFIRPLSEMIRTFPQFPGLVVLGLALVWGKRSHQGRLGFPIGLHAGLVWGYYVVNVGSLITYQANRPEWLSGIDQNPLAGGLGLVLLLGLAAYIRFPIRSKGRSHRNLC
ncbi:MAG: type II CAAX endopeptidase family protein [Synechococcales bacterium]|nr:type II CAAX endopeptidase family protein [Synechococcales bacterium]